MCEWTTNVYLMVKLEPPSYRQPHPIYRTQTIQMEICPTLPLWGGAKTPPDINYQSHSKPCLMLRILDMERETKISPPVQINPDSKKCNSLDQ